MDSDLWIQILELVILLALSGFFSSAETAMVSVSKIRLRTLEDEGNKKATAQADSTGKKPSHRHRVDSEFHCFA